MSDPFLRFYNFVDITGTCWNWTGSKNQGGYGRFSVLGKHFVAHRWLYEQLYGAVDKKLDLDHLCRNRGCVNPAHLEPVTRKENCRRGIARQVAGIFNKAKTHCPNKHEYSDSNTYTRKNGSRKCRICAKIDEKKRRQSKLGENNV